MTIPTNDPAGTAQLPATMFRMGTLNDFRRLVLAHPAGAFQPRDIELMALKYPGEVMPEGMQWGLKQLGNLHVLDYVTGHGLRDVLEIGAGFNFYFANHLPAACTYATLDQSGFYEPELLRQMKERLPRGEFVEGRIGDGSSIEPASKDCCFSVSVLEHIPAGDVKGACDDMYRILKPGGWSVHSLDLTAPIIEEVSLSWFSALKEAGFELDDRPGPLSFAQQDWIRNPPLVEPTSLVARFYYGYRKDIWAPGAFPPSLSAYATVLIAARKPN